MQCCLILFDGNEAFYLCLRLVTYSLIESLTASFFCFFYQCHLLLRFVVIRKVGAKWKFKFLVPFQRTSDACKAIHEVKTPQIRVKHLFASLLCTFVFDCLG